MSVAVATNFFALLTLAAGAGALGVAVLAAAGRTALLREHVGPRALWLAFLVASVTTLGSLYYSEVAGFPPCELCWYQRIAAYPLPVILGVAAWRGDAGVRRYVWPVLAIGALIAGYHYQLEWFPRQSLVACSADVPCSVPWFRAFGFVSLPFMALSSFAAVAALLAVAVPPDARADDGPSPRSDDR
jgi:disulfide bond formation protein DsbB